ncbi:MAG: DUF892 family protein [Solirubrobacteraceae bacterium]|nr:DUF892 family protein [Solirubrobacteraceae bacterium]
MSQARRTTLRYLEEAHATEVTLQRDLQAQIAMTPKGPYRTDLERHLRQTEQHAERVQSRARELGLRRDPVRMGFGLAQSVIGQALSLGRAPLVLLRGSGGEEKLLKNAKDAAASEAMEIATYTAIERLAERVGDTTTAKLAASIRKDEEQMLERLSDHITTLTDHMVDAQLHDDPSYEVARTGAADAARSAARSTKSAAQSAGGAAKRGARRAPGAAQVEGEARGLTASKDDLPIRGYDDLTADQITSKLTDLSQIELGIVDGYERRHDGRSTVLDRVSDLRTSQPWAGYDEQTATDIRSALADADDDTRKAVRDYERRHKGRQSVLAAADRAQAGSSS